MIILKEKIQELLNGTLYENDMKLAIGEYLAERFDTVVPLPQNILNNIMSNPNNPLIYLSNKEFLNLVLRHEYELKIDRLKINTISNGINTLTNYKINLLFTEDELVTLYEAEVKRRYNYSSPLSEQYLTDLILNQLSLVMNDQTLTEDEAKVLINNEINALNVDFNNIVTKADVQNIALTTFNDNIKNTLTDAELVQKIKFEIENSDFKTLTEEEVGDIVLKQIKDIPTDALSFQEAVALVENSISGILTDTINTSSLINYVLKQMEVKKWICEVANPLKVCTESVEEYKIFLKGPDSIFEGNDIPYTVFLTRPYSQDIVIHLSNGLLIPITSGSKSGMVICTPEIHGYVENVYDNEEIYIVNITKVEGLVGYEEYSTDFSSVVKTLIKNTITPVEVSINVPSTGLIGTYLPYTVNLSHIPKTDMKLILKFGTNFEEIVIKKGNTSYSGNYFLDTREAFLIGITDTIGGNFEQVDLSNTYLIHVISAGRHVIYSIDAPNVAMEGDTVTVTFKVNKPSFVDKTTITADINGETKTFVIPMGETEVSYSFQITNTIWES